MSPNLISITKLFPVALCATGFFFYSCENSLKDVEKAAPVEKYSPTETMDTVFTELTDWGKVEMTLSAPRIEKFYDNEPKTIFPEGVRVEFYDSLQQKEAVLTANSGVIFEQEQRVEVENNVVFRNLKEEQTLRTEFLEWRQEQDSSFFESNKQVVIKTPDSRHVGKKGIIANETFSWYRFKGGYSSTIIVKDSTSNE